MNPPLSAPSTKVNRRQKADVLKLINSKYQIEFSDESKMNDFFIKFRGPEGTLYEDGLWTLHVTLPPEYPYKSPSIGFMNRIYHPNVDEISGSICLDVINQTWTPMFDLTNIFEVFIPQLLRYPNASDPLNGQAAQLLLRDENKYDNRVKEYVRLYASNEISNPTISTPISITSSSYANGSYNGGTRGMRSSSPHDISMESDTTSMLGSSFGNDSSHMNSQSGSSVNGSQGGGGKVDCSDSSVSIHTDHDGDIKMTRKDEKEDVDMEEMEEDGMMWETLSDVSEMSDL